MHGFANPKRFLALAGWLTPLLLVSGFFVTAAALYWGFTQVPPDRLMGETVRILGDLMEILMEIPRTAS